MKVGKCKLIKHYEVPMGKNVTEAAKILKKRGVRHLFVTKRKIPMGVISSVDIVNVIADGKSCNRVKVEDIMNFPLHACDAKESLVDAYFKIAKNNIMSLPVLKDNKIVGLLTVQEVMRLLAKKGKKK